LLATLLAAGASSQPDMVLRGSLTGQDNQTWHVVPFDVPAGTTRITVDFDYTTRDARTTIDLGLLGPDGFRGQDGFRGWSGGNKRTFTVSATDATPSYLPGAIRPGRWNLLLGIPNIRPDTKLNTQPVSDLSTPGPMAQRQASRLCEQSQAGIGATCTCTRLTAMARA
jgi:hypothetical protein